MEQIKCPSCGLLNPEGAASCAECGAALTTPYAAPVVAPSDTVVVHRSGTNQAAVLATVALALVALVVVGFLMYQWGRSEQTDEDLAAARSAESRRTPPPSTPPTVTTTPATAPPVVTTYPSPTPTTVTVPVPVPQSTPAPSASASAQNSKYVAEVEPLLGEWESLVTQAKTQTGPTLAQTVTRLEAIERRANRISAPASAASAHGHLLTAMTSTIDALKSSAEVVEDPSSSAALQRAEELYTDFQTEFQSLK
jgi:hypothetical protein